MTIVASAPRADVRDAYRDHMLLVRDFASHGAVGALVLEDDDGVVVADGGLQKPFGVVGRGRSNDLQSGVWAKYASTLWEW